MFRSPQLGSSGIGRPYRAPRRHRAPILTALDDTASPHPRRKLICFAAILMLLVLTAAVGPAIPASLRIFDIAPDFSLNVVVALGLLSGPSAGAAAGFGAAYLAAANTPFSPGSIYLTHILAGYGAGMARSAIYTDHPLVAPLVGAAMGVLSESLFYILNPRDPVLWAQGAAAQAICGLIATPLFCIGLRRLLPGDNSWQEAGH